MPYAIVGAHDRTGLEDFVRLLLRCRWNVHAFRDTAEWLLERSIRVTPMKRLRFATSEEEDVGKFFPAFRFIDDDVLIPGGGRIVPVDLVYVNPVPINQGGQTIDQLPGSISTPQWTTLISGIIYQRVVVCDPADLAAVGQHITAGGWTGDDETGRILCAKAMDMLGNRCREVASLFKNTSITDTTV